MTADATLAVVFHRFQQNKIFGSGYVGMDRLLTRYVSRFLDGADAKISSAAPSPKCFLRASFSLHMQRVLTKTGVSVTSVGRDI